MVVCGVLFTAWAAGRNPVRHSFEIPKETGSLLGHSEDISRVTGAMRIVLRGMNRLRIAASEAVLR